MDGDAGDPDPGAEGRELPRPLAVAERRGEHQREVGPPEHERAPATEERLEDQPDPGPRLEGVVGEQAQRRAGGEQLPHRRAPTRLASVPIPSISSSTVCPGWTQRSSSSPQHPGIVPVEITSPGSSRSPAAA